MGIATKYAIHIVYIHTQITCVPLTGRALADVKIYKEFTRYFQLLPVSLFPRRPFNLSWSKKKHTYSINIFVNIN